jgi:hypothetical protein
VLLATSCVFSWFSQGGDEYEPPAVDINLFIEPSPATVDSGAELDFNVIVLDGSTPLDPQPPATEIAWSLGPGYETGSIEQSTGVFTAGNSGTFTDLIRVSVVIDGQTYTGSEDVTVNQSTE